MSYFVPLPIQLLLCHLHFVTKYCCCSELIISKKKTVRAEVRRWSGRFYIGLVWKGRLLRKPLLALPRLSVSAFMFGCLWDGTWRYAAGRGQARGWMASHFELFLKYRVVFNLGVSSPGGCPRAAAELLWALGWIHYREFLLVCAFGVRK